MPVRTLRVRQVPIILPTLPYCHSRCWTRSVQACIPTQSVGTRKKFQPECSFIGYAKYRAYPEGTFCGFIPIDRGCVRAF